LFFNSPGQIKGQKTCLLSGAIPVQL